MSKFDNFRANLVEFRGEKALSVCTTLEQSELSDSMVKRKYFLIDHILKQDSVPGNYERLSWRIYYELMWKILNIQIYSAYK